MKKLEVGDVILQGTSAAQYLVFGIIHRVTENFAFIKFSNSLEYKFRRNYVHTVTLYGQDSSMFTYWVANQIELKTLEVKRMIKAIQNFPFSRYPGLTEQVYAILRGELKDEN